jgi:large subunit ribosomal protein L22
MEIVAKSKFIRISPKKVRPLLKDLRSKKVSVVLPSLNYAQTKAGHLLYKLIASATANATNNYNLKADNLKIKTLTADDGPRFKRHWLRSHGSADVILKRNAHLTVVLEEIVPTLAIPSKVSDKKVVISKSSAIDTDGSKETTTNKLAIDDNTKVKRSGGSGLKRIFRRTTNK